LRRQQTKKNKTSQVKKKKKQKKGEIVGEKQRKTGHSETGVVDGHGGLEEGLNPRGCAKAKKVLCRNRQAIVALLERNHALRF
jgi:hypothetical protein